MQPTNQPSAALKEEQLDAIRHMKKNFLAEEKEMFQLEYDVEELEDQKRVNIQTPYEYSLF